MRLQVSFLVLFSAALLDTSSRAAFGEPAAAEERADELPGTHSEPQTTTKTNLGCKNCNKSKRHLLDERTLRLQLFKDEILNKLRMKEAPKFPSPKVTIPAPLMTDTSVFSDDQPEKMTNDDYYGKTTQVIIFTEEEETSRFASKQKTVKYHSLLNQTIAQFAFRITEKIFFHEKIDRVNLYVHKEADPMTSRRNHMLQLTALTSPLNANGRPVEEMERKIITSQKTRANENGWLVFDVGDIVKHWVKSCGKAYMAGNETGVHFFVKFEVRCLDCGSALLSLKGTDRPFMVIYPKFSGFARNRRAIDCDGETTTCCRQQFKVSVKELDWQNWIIQPLYFTPNYCTGTCHGQMLLPKHYHTSVLQKYSVLTSRANIGLCCVPTKMSSLSLVYYDNEGYIVKRDLPNMKVEECGCS